MTMSLESTLVTSDGASLWFELRGRGAETPVVLMDGLGCDGFIWRYLWEPLTKSRRVLHMHYRGHGLSTVARDDTRIGIEYICDDLKQVMEHVQMPEAIFLGHSMGVQVSLEFHRRHASHVRGLGLICGSFGTPLDTWHDHSLMRRFFPYLEATVEQLPDLSRRLVSRVVQTDLAVTLGIQSEANPTLLKRSDFAPYMSHMAKMHPLYFIRTLSSLKDHSAWDHLPLIDVPTLVAGGEIDRFTPAWLSAQMASRIPAADYLQIPGGSHTAPLERPELVLEAVTRLLEKSTLANAPAPKTATLKTKPVRGALKTQPSKTKED
jgi:pimeloyl-ACP methyl ester carboxylesterase